MPLLTDTWIATPLGQLRLVATNHSLVGLYFAEHHGAPSLATQPSTKHPVLEQTRVELAQYFAGIRTSFGVPLAPTGTAFQQSVWQALRQLPYASVATYGELASRLGRPTAARAVGAANGRNPISIIVPCHRVVGANGLTGYAGGVSAKAWLLAHEAAHKSASLGDNAPAQGDGAEAQRGGA